MIDEDKFFAWLDGELEPAEAAEYAERVTGDPALSKLALQHRSLRLDLERAFGSIIDSPVPAHIIEPLHPAANVIDIAAARRRRPMPPLIQWGAIAASLGIGILVGIGVPSHSNLPVRSEAGALFASASLNRGLDGELASAPSGDVRIGMTFRDHAGTVCRTFTARETSGLACRSGKDWKLKGLFAVPEGQQDSYRMASGMDPGLAQMVNSTIAGEPLDADAERKERSKDWR